MASIKSWDYAVGHLCNELFGDAVYGPPKVNREQFFVLAHLADGILKFLESWNEMPNGIPNSSNSWTAEVATELLTVLNRGLDLHDLCHQTDSPSIIFSILGCTGELTDIIEDVMEYVHTINDLLKSPANIHITSEIELECKALSNFLESWLEKASQEDRAAIILSLKDYLQSPGWRSIWFLGDLGPSILQILETGINERAPNIIHSQLTINNLLGQGTYGSVSSAQWGGLPVAVKKNFSPESFGSELRIFTEMLSIDAYYYHPHIVHILGFTEEKHLVLELMEKDLKKHIEELEDPLPLIHSLDMMLQIAKAMRYLHSKNVIHRDLKSGNVLLKIRHHESPLIKITDFGISKENFETTRTNTVRGTLKYMAPEMIKRLVQGEGRYSKKVDVYSFGVICDEMRTTKVLQETAHKTVPDQLTILLQSCIEENPDDRPEFKDICDKLWLVKKQVLTATKPGWRPTRTLSTVLTSKIWEPTDKCNYVILQVNLSEYRAAVSEKWDEAFDSSDEAIDLRLIFKVNSTIDQYKEKVESLLSQPRYQKWKIEETKRWESFLDGGQQQWSRRNQDHCYVLKYVMAMKQEIIDLCYRIVRDPSDTESLQRQVQNHFDPLFERTIKRAEEEHKSNPLELEVPKFVNSCYENARLHNLERARDILPDPEELNSIIFLCSKGERQYADYVVERVIQATRIYFNSLDTKTRGVEESLHKHASALVTEELKYIQGNCDVLNYNTVGKLRAEEDGLHDFFVKTLTEFEDAQKSLHDL